MPVDATPSFLIHLQSGDTEIQNHHQVMGLTVDAAASDSFVEELGICRPDPNWPREGKSPKAPHCGCLFELVLQTAQVSTKKRIQPP